MNALEDTRELVTTTSAPDTLDAADAPWRKLHDFVAGFVEDLLSQWPDVELASIHITETDGVITVTGRRGTLTATECPSCHAADGHPCTDYCNLTKPLAGNIEVRAADDPRTSHPWEPAVIPKPYLQQKPADT